MSGEATITISVLIAIVGCGIGIATFVGNLIKNRTGDSSNQAATNARIESKIDAMSKNVLSVEAGFQGLSRTVIDHGERIAVLESKGKKP